MKDKRGYFARLKDHPGLGMGFILTVMGTFAGASNKSFENPPRDTAVIFEKRCRKEKIMQSFSEY